MMHIYVMINVMINYDISWDYYLNLNITERSIKIFACFDIVVEKI